MTELERLRAVIRELREVLWLEGGYFDKGGTYHPGYSPAHEREWESEQDCASREARNAEARERWDAETNQMCGGDV